LKRGTWNWGRQLRGEGDATFAAKLRATRVLGPTGRTAEHERGSTLVTELCPLTVLVVTLRTAHRASVLFFLSKSKDN
jgi:hypothetical protein